VEGLVRVANIRDDYYDYVPERFGLIGSRSKRTFHIGDSVRITVTGANAEAMEIDFELAE